MARANRYVVAGAAYHVTHRCHDRYFLLKFASDRDRYRDLLRTLLQESPVSLLSYCITSNHVHLLLSGDSSEAIARLMQAVQGRFAEDYNRRKHRQGAFWSDRYHATMIGGREHCWSCLRYIDLNMVRAGVVRHPRDWAWTGWHELTGDRKRYRLIDRDAVLARFEGLRWRDLRGQYAETVEAALSRRSPLRREAQWTESVAVGSREFVTGAEQALELKNRRNRMACKQQADGTWVLRERSPQIGLYAITRLENRL